MTAEVVVCVADVEDVARLASAQRAFGLAPIHVWFPRRRSSSVAARAKRQLHDVLARRELRHGPSPLLRPAHDLLREAQTLDRVVSLVLADDPARRCFSSRAGSFMGRPVEVIAPETALPFDGPWFLIVDGVALEGEGSFGDLLASGQAVTKYPRELCCEHDARSRTGQRRSHADEACRTGEDGR